MNIEDLDVDELAALKSIWHDSRQHRDSLADPLGETGVRLARKGWLSRSNSINGDVYDIDRRVELIVAKRWP